MESLSNAQLSYNTAINNESKECVDKVMNTSLKETNDLLELLTIEENRRFGQSPLLQNSDSEDNTKKERPKFRRARPQSAMPSRREYPPDEGSGKINRKIRPKSGRTKMGDRKDDHSTYLISASPEKGQLKFLPSRPKSAISNTRSRALLAENLSNPFSNKNYSFPDDRVREIKRENMRLYKNLMKINKSNPPKVFSKPQDNVSSVTSSKSNRKSRPSSAMSKCSMTSIRSSSSYASTIMSRASASTSFIKPVPASKINREKVKEKIDKENLRIYSRLNQVKPTFTTRFY